jgi:trehalose/maltose transport system permease protein
MRRERVRAAWLFLLPTLVVLALVAGWPLARTLWFGLTDARLDTVTLGEVRFIGLDNFRALWEDPSWWQSVWVTLRFTAISVALETVLGLVIAMALNARFRGRGVLRAAVLVPWAIPTIVSARMWSWMFHDVYGVINDVLLRLGLISEPVAWTADPALSILAVIAVDVWKTTPFMALLILAALQQLPQEVYEAAKIDGAGPVRVFFRVTLPLIRGPLMVAVIFRVLDAMRVFDLFYILTNNSSESMSMAVYSRQQMFDFQEVGMGAAASSALFMIIALITVAYLVLMRRGLQEEI